jgi:endogenous inhibitor of DNA gyrase (YacG/DUF329 family)
MPSPDNAKKAQGAAPKQRCPICKKPTVKAFRPFCSKRCADLDLSRWLKGHYAIPQVEEDGGSLDDEFEQ